MKMKRIIIWFLPDRFYVICRQNRDWGNGVDVSYHLISFTMVNCFLKWKKNAKKRLKSEKKVQKWWKKWWKRLKMMQKWPKMTQKEAISKDTDHAEGVFWGKKFKMYAYESAVLSYPALLALTTVWGGVFKGAYM